MISVRGYEIDQTKSLGKGSFGTVYKASDVSCRIKGRPHLRAIKVINVSHERDLTEGKLLAKCRHAHVIRCFEQFTEPCPRTRRKQLLYIVMDFATRGDLCSLVEEHARKKVPFGEAEVVDYLTQMALGLHEMHKNKCLHRDLKSKNVMCFQSVEGFNKRGIVLKLGDFGLSKMLLPQDGDCAKTKCGTYSYMAPEVCSKSAKSYSYTSDVWPLGVIVFEMCQSHTGKYFAGGGLFPRGSTMGHVLTFLNNQVPAPTISADGYGESLRQLVGVMLHKRPSKRASLLDVFGAQVVKDGVEHAMTVRQGLDIRCKTKVHRHGEHKHIKAQAQAQERAPPLQQFEVRKWEPRGQRHRDKTKEKQYAERVRARNKLEFDRQQRARDDIAGMEARHEQQLAKNERARGLTPPEHEQQMKGRHAQVDGFDPTDGNPCRAPYVPKFDASEEFMVHEGAPPAAVGQRARKQLEHEPRVIARHEDAKPVPAQVAVIKADARGGIQPARVGADDDPAQKLMLSSSSSSEGEGDEDNDLISHMNTMMDLGLLKPLQGAHGHKPRARADASRHEDPKVQLLEDALGHTNFKRARSLYMQLMDVLDFDSTMLRTLHAYAENVPNGTRARRLQRLAELGQARHRD